MNIGVKVEGDKEFKKLFQDYAKWNNRQPADIINAKLYFVALNAMGTTKTADKEEIKAKLEAPSKDYPKAPLAGVLVNKQLKAKGKKGLTGAKMAEAIKKFIKKNLSRTQFLRSGWIPSIKKLDFWNRKGDISFVKRFAPKRPQGIRQYGKEKGDVIAAKPYPKCFGTIFNFIGKGKQASSTVTPILEEGLKKAVRIEMASMVRYIERKYKEKIDKFNKSNTFK